jgi:hypothetical protein
MHHKMVANKTKADTTLSLTRALFVDIIVGHARLKDTLFSDDLSANGSKLDLI